MKKNHSNVRSGLNVMAAGVVGIMSLASCASDGFDNSEKWETVTNTHLSSPDVSKLTFKSVAASDGTDKVQVSWPVVMGAGGYECKAINIDDPDNPVVLVEDTIDGVTFQFPQAEDTKYRVEIRTLGNAAQNNTAADTAAVASYSTLVEAQTIPNGSDIYEFISSALPNLPEGDTESAFELEAGGQYTCSGVVDFQGHKMTLRGNKINYATITMGESAIIETSSQLKVKFLNFDCTAMTNKQGVIQLSDNPPANKSAEAQGVGAGKSNNQPADVYILQDPIIIQNCAFKNVPNCLFAVGNCSWGLSDVRVINSIVQLNCDGSKNSNGAVICAYSSGFKSPSGAQFWYGGIKSITVKESTFLNLVDNSKCRFIRFNNKDLDRVFPSASGSITMTDNTFVRTYNKKEFGNNTPNANTYKITFNNNIFYDIYRLQKLFQSNCAVTWSQGSNTIWGVGSTVDGTDKSKWATEEDPEFEGDTKAELDFTKENCGLNLTAKGTISSTIGDPRWIKK